MTIVFRYLMEIWFRIFGRIDFGDVLDQERTLENRGALKFVMVGHPSMNTPQTGKLLIGTYVPLTPSRSIPFRDQERRLPHDMSYVAIE